jgi:hypothetical protein
MGTDFPELDFDSLNEADVREEVVAPLIRELGYRSATKNNVIREQTLAYPRRSLGRRKSSDRPLRGRADYILEAGGRVRWVIDAKSPSEPLDRLAEEQSYTYANHPEVRAVYHCLCNGRELAVWRTNHGPEAPPVFTCSYAQLHLHFDALSNLLSPEALLRDHPDVTIDSGPSLGSGLRSVMRIANGWIVIDRNSLNLPALTGWTVTMTAGWIERSTESLEAYFETIAHHEKQQRFNERLGLHALHLSGPPSRLSVDCANPTILEGATQHEFRAGEPFWFDFTSGLEHALVADLKVETLTHVHGTLTATKTFSGRFDSTLRYFGLPGQDVFAFDVLGRFSANLS